MSHQLIDIFFEQWLDYALQIREGRGLNVPLHEELTHLLKRIRSSLEGKDAIPKNLAEIFLDMWGAITSSAGLYDHPTQQVIHQAADELTGLAREICTS